MADPRGGAIAASGRLRVLASLVTVEAVLMVAAAIAYLGYVLAEGNHSGFRYRHDAVTAGWGLATTLTLWAGAAAVRRGRRWSFSVVLFTQMMWGFIALASLSSSGGLYLFGLLVVVAVVIATTAVLFHPEVRHLLGRGPAPSGSPGPPDRS
jgi:hypothetical protein